MNPSLMQKRPPLAPSLLAQWRVFKVICVLGGALILVTGATQGVFNALTKETGGVQIFGLSLFVYGAALTFWLAHVGQIALFEVSGGFGLLALRELDFQDWWFEPGVLHLSFYFAPGPIWEKAVGGCLIGVILWILLRLLIRGVKPVLNGLKNREAWSLALLFGGLLGYLSTVLDGAGRKLASHGIYLTDTNNWPVTVAEELVELGFAFTFVLAVLLFLQHVSAEEHQVK